MTVNEYGYEPERRDDTNGQHCYCQWAAVGVTRFWSGRVSKYVWHCANHLPASPRIMRAVTS